MTRTTTAFKVLCVEDDRITGLLFTEALRPLPGVELRVAEDIASARRQCSGWAPDLLVIDAHLPDGSGTALLPELRALHPGHLPPAYLCSADDDAGLHRSAREAGFVACWAKPVPPERWRQLVAQLSGSAVPAPARR